MARRKSFTTGPMNPAYDDRFRVEPPPGQKKEPRGMMLGGRPRGYSVHHQSGVSVWRKPAKKH